MKPYITPTLVGLSTIVLLGLYIIYLLFVYLFVLRRQNKKYWVPNPLVAEKILYFSNPRDIPSILCVSRDWYIVFKAVPFRTKYLNPIRNTFVQLINKGRFCEAAKMFVKKRYSLSSQFKVFATRLLSCENVIYALERIRQSMTKEEFGMLVDKNNIDLLHCAVKTRNFPTVRYLYEHIGFRTTKFNHTPLRFCFVGKYCPLEFLQNFVELLKENGQNIKKIINSQDFKGNTCLHWALYTFADYDIINYLIKCGVDLDIRNNKGQTPLMLAVKNGVQPTGIPELFSKGSRAHEKDSNGVPVLYYALSAQQCSVAVLKWLLQQNVNLKQKITGLTCVQYAQKHNQIEDVINLLKEAYEKQE